MTITGIISSQLFFSNKDEVLRYLCDFGQIRNFVVISCPFDMSKISYLKTSNSQLFCLFLQQYRINAEINRLLFRIKRSINPVSPLSSEELDRMSVIVKAYKYDLLLKTVIYSNLLESVLQKKWEWRNSSTPTFSSTGNWMNDARVIMVSNQVFLSLFLLK